MGQAGNTDQFLHGGRLCLHQHALHEAGAELRNAQRAGLTEDLILRHPQRLGAGKQTHDLLVVQRNFPEVHAGQFFQAVHHGGVVVAQTVQLHQNVVHGVEVVVGGQGGAVDVVRRVLDGGELADVVLLGQHDDAAGVLAGGALYAHAARRQPFLMGTARLDAPLLQILGGEAVGRLFRQTGDGARSIHEALAEKFFDVGMGPGLIFAGEVQVDVGHLVALEAQKDLEGDVVTVFFEGIAANFAVLVRQVHAHGAQLRRSQEHFVAVVAAVVGRQGVHLGDTVHGGHEAGTHAAAAADQIAVG